MIAATYTSSSLGGEGSDGGKEGHGGGGDGEFSRVDICLLHGLPNHKKLIHIQRNGIKLVVMLK